MANADSFGLLFSRSWAAFKPLWRPLLAGALAASLITTPLQHALQNTILELRTDPNTAVVMMGLFMIVSFVVGLLAYFYMMVVAVKNEPSPTKVLSQLGSVAWPLTLVSFWVIVKSYSWLAFLALLVLGGIAFVPEVMRAALGLVGFVLLAVALILALILGPRYVPAPFIYLKEKLSPKAAVLASYDRTAGYWGKIFGNALLLGIIAAVIGGAIGIPLGMVSGTPDLAAIPQPAPLGTSALIAAFVSGVVSILIQGFTMIFWSKLTDTITANPRAKEAKVVA